MLATLNTDFSITGMSALEITALVAAWQAGAISQATMLDLFRAGEVIAPGRTNEEEIDLLKEESGSRKAEMPTTTLVKPPVAASKSETPQPIV